MADVRLPSLYLGSKMSLIFGPTNPPLAFNFTGKSLLLVLDCRESNTRVQLTEADATVASDGGIVEFAKGAAWVIANLPTGDYECHLYGGATVDTRRHLMQFNRTVAAPALGRPT